jgi:hypothetical protein
MKIPQELLLMNSIAFQKETPPESKEPRELLIASNNGSAEK